MSYPFLKGHGTENDFVLLPDHDRDVHGDLDEARVRALCDRHAGIGADGVLRVVRSHGDADWFMDYRNADGSLSEMCGNGIRVFARHLVDEGLATSPLRIDTRAGVKTVTVDGDRITVDMGRPTVGGWTHVTVGDGSWEARQVGMGNPHAVAFVDDLLSVGPLTEPPGHDPETYPEGANVEFVVRRDDRHLAMRVHERGSGETRSCGTGACAVMVAAALADGRGPGSTYRVDLPGGTLEITWTEGGTILMTGPAVIVARGETDL